MQEIDKYTVESEDISTVVKILGDSGKSFKYRLILPKFEPATLALLDNIKTELITEVSITNIEILDPNSIIRLKERFSKKARTLIKEKLPNIESHTLNVLISSLIHEMLGLGNIEFLMNDPHLEEIVIVSSKKPVMIYHKKHGWLETNIMVKSEEEIINYSNIIARRVGRQITTLTPLLDAHLITGDRANAVLYPISTKGNTITIRKFARDPWTVTDLIKNNTCNSGIFALIWLAIQYELNILISGGTASGKTSFLNVCMSFIPYNHRVLNI